MDTVIMLDASGSETSENWRSQVEFARKVALLLQASFAKRNSSFRASLGQFSTGEHIEIPLTSDIKGHFGNLSTWQCEQRWDDMCDNDDEKKRCLENSSCIVRRNGFTEIGAALCGQEAANTEKPRTAASCVGGAMGELVRDG